MGRSELAALLHPQRGSRAAQHAAQPGRGLGPRRKQIVAVAIDNMSMQTRRQIRAHGPAAHGPAFLQGFVKGRLKGRVAVFAAQGIGHGHEPVLGGPKKIRPHTKGRTPRHGPHERQRMLRHTGQGVDTGKKLGFHTVTKNVFPSAVSGVASPKMHFVFWQEKNGTDFFAGRGQSTQSREFCSSSEENKFFTERSVL